MQAATYYDCAVDLFNTILSNVVDILQKYICNKWLFEQMQVIFQRMTICDGFCRRMIRAEFKFDDGWEIECENLLWQSQ